MGFILAPVCGVGAGVYYGTGNDLEFLDYFASFIWKYYMSARGLDDDEAATPSAVYCA